jgi:hypothetical protein
MENGSQHIADIDPIESYDIDRFEDDDEDVDELKEYYQKKTTYGQGKA